MKHWIAAIVVCLVHLASQRVCAQGDWEITPASQQALERGLQWLERNQGPNGNWESNDLGLVSMGALAFLADGHTPGRGRYGDVVQKALDYVLRNAKPSGLLNISNDQRDMYNHGLSAFVLGQAHGMTNDQRISPVLDRALKLIANTQCDDGGWDYRAKRRPQGHDLSLAVMQAKALRSAVDSGLEVPPEVIELAIKSVREHYSSIGAPRGKVDEKLSQQLPGQFTYNRYGNGRSTVAMAACGVVCMQEFGQYDDWRIAKSMDVVLRAVRSIKPQPGSGYLPRGTNPDTKKDTQQFDAYTLYYVGQALYQVGGKAWSTAYPQLRDAIVANQYKSDRDPRLDGVWRNTSHVDGRPGDLYATSVACFVLAMPNRYLPILQEGRIDSLRTRFQQP